MDENIKALYKIVALTALGDMAETISTIASGLLDLVGCDAVTVYLYDEERETFAFPPTIAGDIRFPEALLELGRVQKDSVVARVISTNEIIISENVSDDPLLSGQFTQREAIKSVVGVPLIAIQHKVGVLFINFRNIHHFTESELVTIRLFSSQAAIAIYNNKLLKQLQTRADTLAAVYEASQAVTATLDLDRVLSSITEQASRLTSITQSKSALSYLALVDGDKLVIVASFPAEYLGKIKSTFENIDLANKSRIGINGRAVITGKAQMVNNVMEDSDYIAYTPETRSEIAIPMIIGDKVIGVLSVENPTVSAFAKEDVRVLEALASQASIAIQNARRYEELKQTKGMVGSRTALAWMGMTSSVWRHSIANYAVTIRDQISLLRRGLENQENRDSIDKRLNDIELVAKEIQELPILAPLSSEEGISSVQINDFLKERTRRLWNKESYRAIELRLNLVTSDEATVSASPEWLRRALDILIENALDAVAGQTQARVTISSRESDNDIEIHISDSGPGIPLDLQSRLFVAPINKKSGSKGTGLGLMLAQAILQAYKGSIRLTETGPTGTTMVIQLPKEGIQELDYLSKHYDESSPSDWERLYKESLRDNEKLKELDRKKTEFLSTVSHELRTPITSVQSCIENLLSGMYGFVNEKQQSRLNIALVSAREESRLIANLLDIARIQEGNTVLDLVSGNICKTIHDVIEVFRYDAMQKNISLTEDFPADELPEIIADTGKIKQIVTNLISNALKFTSDGGTIVIYVRKLDKLVEIKVKDTGIGIPEEEFSKIFDRFYQVDSSLTRKVGGTGIGLNIAKEYIEMHDGRIWVESKVGEGSIFIFTIPITRNILE